MGVSKGNVTEECVGDGVFLYTLERGGVRAVFTNWGATLMSLCVPDAQGKQCVSDSVCLSDWRTWQIISDVVVSPWRLGSKFWFWF